jgi:hypothetical protein
VALLDVMPTILDLARVDTSKLLLEGDSVVDLLEGNRSSYWENRIVTSEEVIYLSKKDPSACGSLLFRNLHVITSQFLWPGARFFPAMLRMVTFDFKKDRQERRVLLSYLPDLIMRRRFAGIVRKLQKTNMAAWQKWEGGANETYRLDPEAVERLRALGYIK